MIEKPAIELGTSGDRMFSMDLEALLRTRLLVQANSGGGKSWLLRRLAERLFGHVQVAILDPEGEFSSLRERFGFVLAGPGGETPADPRSAELLARRLLELKASAVCDLYELPKHDRHRWVRTFCEALIDAPKGLWRPLVVIVDEAHVYCPEKGAGESEASSAMIDLATRGRKRGLCAVFATQRLGKLRKDAAAELTNVLVGRTWMDVDRDRAADMLDVPRACREAFSAEIRSLAPGHFYAMGPALCTQRALVTVGPVITTHASIGPRHAASAPPTPEAVRALLPKLSDLPKEAVKKAQTEAELRDEINTLRGKLAEASVEKAPGDREQSLADLEIACVREELAAVRAELEWRLAFEDRLRKKLEEISASFDQALTKEEITRALAVTETPAHLVPTTVDQNEVRAELAHRIPAQEGLPRPRAAILEALSRLRAIGREPVPRQWVALLAHASPRSSAFANNLGAMRSAGLIEYAGGGTVQMTASGRRQAPARPAPLTQAELLRDVLGMLPRPQQAIVEALHRLGGRSMTREDLAAAAGASAGSSAFANNLGALRTLGAIEYGAGRTVRCADWLYLRGDRP